MKLPDPNNAKVKDYRWHLYFCCHCNWIPSWPKPCPFRTGLDLYKFMHQDKWEIKMPRIGDADFVADLWFKDLETDDCLYELVKYCRKRFNTMKFSAELKIEDSAADPAWEFLVAWWKWGDMFIERQNLTHAYMSAQEAELLLGTTPYDNLFFTSIAILRLREQSRIIGFEQGGLQYTITNCLENNWSEALFKRQ